MYTTYVVLQKWLQNYLANKKQYVVINDDCSDLLDMTCGVAPVAYPGWVSRGFPKLATLSGEGRCQYLSIT